MVGSLDSQTHEIQVLAIHMLIFMDMHTVKERQTKSQRTSLRLKVSRMGNIYTGL